MINCDMLLSVRHFDDTARCSTTKGENWATIQSKFDIGSSSKLIPNLQQSVFDKQILLWIQAQLRAKIGFVRSQQSSARLIDVYLFIYLKKNSIKTDYAISINNNNKKTTTIPTTILFTKSSIASLCAALRAFGAFLCHFASASSRRRRSSATTFAAALTASFQAKKKL